MYLTLLQAVDSTLADGGAGITEEKISILELLFKGGWFMVPIAILLVIAIYIFFERYMTIKKAATIGDDFMVNIRDHVLGGNVHAAKDLCAKTDNPIARMIEKGLARIGKPLKNIDVAIENVGKLELYRLEKSLATLATISGAAPMVGFLGTVTGMIRAFYTMSKAGNNIDPSMLAGGIYEAMMTTALGLAVGIIAFMGYNLLVAMVEKVVHQMEATSVEFIDLLEEPAA